MACGERRDAAQWCPNRRRRLPGGKRKRPAVPERRRFLRSWHPRLGAPPGGNRGPAPFSRWHRLSAVVAQAVRCA
jgi:hypothetical protein